MKIQVHKQWNKEQPIFVLIQGNKKLTIDLIRNCVGTEKNKLPHRFVVINARDSMEELRELVNWFEDDTE